MFPMAKVAIPFTYTRVKSMLHPVDIGYKEKQEISGDTRVKIKRGISK